jgi:Holliday junction resolvase RusA-like endonuclease
MSSDFAFTMPGQPPSWNHMYRWTTRNVNGRQVRIQVKTEAAATYQTQLAWIARSACPSDFRPEGQVIVTYNMFLDRDLDADNVMKAVNDALATAIGINDKRFLPVTLIKEHGHKNPEVYIACYDAEEVYVAVKANP